METTMELVAGREMDAQIHMRVFRHPEECRLIGEGVAMDPIRLDNPDAAYRVRSPLDQYWERWSPNGVDRIVNDFVPPYSTDIGAAWMVVRHVRELVFSNRNAFTRELQRAISERVFPRDKHSLGEPGYLLHLDWMILDVTPEDICRAALFATSSF